MITLFIVTESNAAPGLDGSTLGAMASSVPVYHLEDQAGVLSELNTYEYDLMFESMPEDLEAGLKDLLGEACSRGALVAWSSPRRVVRFRAPA